MDFVYKTDAGSEFLLETTAEESIDKLVLSMNSEIDESFDFVRICGSPKETSKIIDEKYQRLKEVLSLSNDELLLSIPKPVMKARLKCVVEQLELILEDTNNKDYLVTYLTIKRFLRSLSRPSVDKLKLKQIISNEVHEGVKQSMSSLMPCKDGLVSRSHYNLAGSSTGRLTINKGPNILTMKSSAREAFKSSYSEGSILQIDLSAAEPNIALNIAGLEANKDVYQHIATEILKNTVSRSDAKLIILCALYGQSASKLQRFLPSNLDARSIIRKCREYFDVNNLEKNLLKLHRAGNLRNVLGRPLKLDKTDSRLLISYYLQSSAAELAVVMFSELINEFRQQRKGVKPLFIIHDALILDCDKFTSNDLLSKEIINLRMGKWTFYAKVSKVS